MQVHMQYMYVYIYMSSPANHSAAAQCKKILLIEAYKLKIKCHYTFT